MDAELHLRHISLLMAPLRLAELSWGEQLRVVRKETNLVWFNHPSLPDDLVRPISCYMQIYPFEIWVVSSAW